MNVWLLNGHRLQLFSLEVKWQRLFLSRFQKTSLQTTRRNVVASKRRNVETSKRSGQCRHEKQPRQTVIKSYLKILLIKKTSIREFKSLVSGIEPSATGFWVLFIKLTTLQKLSLTVFNVARIDWFRTDNGSLKKQLLASKTVEECWNHNVIEETRFSSERLQIKLVKRDFLQPFERSSFSIFSLPTPEKSPRKQFSR